MQEYRERVNNAILHFMRMGVRFTAEDVRELSGDPPHPNSLGGLMIGALKAGVIERVAWTKAKRKGSHARNIQVYEGVKGLVLEDA